MRNPQQDGLLLGARRLTVAALLAGTAMVGWIDPAAADPDGCTQSGGTAVCEDDQSNGITSGVEFDAGTTLLKIRNLDGPITPQDGKAGLFFEATGSTEVRARANVMTTGGGDGFYVQSPGSIDFDFKGSITASGQRGIFLNSINSSVTVSADGEIHSYNEAIFAQAAREVTVYNDADLVSDNLKGIFANSTGTAGYDVYVRNSGDIVANQDTLSSGGEAIFAQGYGNVTVINQADLTSENLRGIFANVAGSGPGNVLVDHKGQIISEEEAIFAQATSSVEVYSNGALTSGHRGIYAIGENGTATVESKGKIVSVLDGIFAQATGNVTVRNDGDITSASVDFDPADRAIFAISTGGGTAEVYSQGRLQSRLDTIFLQARDNVRLENDGDLISSAARGIYAEALSGGMLYVNTKGMIDAFADGIHARGSAGVELYNDGDVTSATQRGMFVESTVGPVFIRSVGDIRSNSTDELDALFARSAGDLTVTSDGFIYSNSFRGAFLESFGGTVDVDISGGVEAEWEGVFVSGPGDVYADIRGDVTSEGWRGILATRSLSGGAPGGMIELTYGGGTVQSLGGTDTLTQAHGIEVDADSGSSLVTILADGIATGGSNTSGTNDSYAVLFKSGTNHLVNWGEINEDNGGYALGGLEDGDDTIDNYNLVEGSSFLGGGINTFNNFETGLYRTGMTVDLGTGNNLNNYGTVSPFGTGTIGTTTLSTGNFMQMPTGYFLVDVDFETEAHDLLEVPSGSVGAGGYVGAYITNFGTSTSPVGPFTVIDNTGGTGISDDGIIGADQGPILVTVVRPIASTVDIGVAVDFGFAGLDGNQAELGDYFQDQFEDLAGGGFTPEQEAFFLALVNSGNTSDYEDNLDSLSPEYANAAIEAAFSSVQAFGSNFFSCSVRDGGYRFLNQNTCGWGIVSGRYSDRDGSDGDIDSDDRAASVAAGAQFTREAWSFGFGFGYERGETDAATTELDRDQFNFGLVAKRRWDAFEFAAAAVGGVGDIESRRSVMGMTARGDRDFHYLGAVGRATYVWETGSGYLKPILEGAVTYLSADGYDETGAGLANLSVSSTDDVVGRGSAMLEIGTEFGSAGATLVRPYAGAGLSVLLGDDTEVTASFPGLSSDTITLASDFDDVYADLKVGVQVLGSQGWTGRVQYDGHFSGDSQQHGGSAKISIPF